MTLAAVPDVSSVTSLQLAYCKAQCMSVLLSTPATAGAGADAGGGPYLVQLPPRSYRGLRADQTALVPPAVLGALSSRALQSLLSDAVAALTPAHIGALTPAQFAALDLGGLNVNSGAVMAVSPTQIIAVTAPQWSAQWSCKQFNNMTAGQRGVMAPTALASFERDCSGGAAPPPAPGPGPGPGPGPLPGPCPSVGYNETVYVGSVAGAAGGTAVLVILFYCIFLRPAAGSPRGKKALDGGAGSEAEEYQYAGYGGVAGSSGSMSVRRSYGDIGSPQLRQPLHAGSLGGGHLGSGVGVTALVHAGSSPTSYRHPNTLSPHFAQANDLQDDDQPEELGSRL